MGSALAQAALDLGHDVTIVSGPVSIKYPAAATVIHVVSTQEMLDAAVKAFASCDGVIAAAAPCDFKPANYSKQKIKKDQQPLELSFVETTDILGKLGSEKRTDQWSVGFALETEDGKKRALAKLQKKNCDLIVLNGPTAIDSPDNQVDIIAADGKIARSVGGSKTKVAEEILTLVEERLIVA